MPYDASKDRTSQKTNTTFQARRAKAITPSDTQDLDPYVKCVYVGVAGDLKYIPTKNRDNDPVTIPNAPVGYHPIQARRIMVSAASGIVGFWDDEG